MMGFSGVWLNHRATSSSSCRAAADQRPARPARSAAGDGERHGGVAAGGAEDSTGRRTTCGSSARGRCRGRRGRRQGRGQASAALMQPERWTFNFGGPNRSMQVEYWAGNKSASVRTTANGFVATLTNLHKGVGMPIAVDPADRHAGRQPDLPVDQRRDPVVGDQSPPPARPHDLRRVGRHDGGDRAVAAAVMRRPVAPTSLRHPAAARRDQPAYQEPLTPPSSARCWRS